MFIFLYNSFVMHDIASDFVDFIDMVKAQTGHDSKHRADSMGATIITTG